MESACGKWYLGEPSSKFPWIYWAATSDYYLAMKLLFGSILSANANILE